MRAVLKVFIILFSCLIFSCNVSANDKIVTFYGDNVKKLCIFKVEIASTPVEHEMGLMFRKSLDKNAGMLFIYSKEEIQFFWMKNTFIPLDIIFIDSNFTVVDAYRNAKPHDETTIASKAAARFVLEINAGIADRCRIKAGVKVRFSGFSAH